ncbi:MAG TPA: nuclear transport factor 2 family protein [Xanthobacteraceae bacterium]|nr:nuclear transport factor 2 family protein [Xanthobacteraceae bacterium]
MTDTRAAIDSLLDKAYAARRAQDVQGACALFTDDGRFMANGAPAATKSRTEQVAAMQGMFDTFELVEFREHCRIIDPPRAVVHWRGTFRTTNGQVTPMCSTCSRCGTAGSRHSPPSSIPPTRRRSLLVRPPVNRRMGPFSAVESPPLPRQFNYSFMTPTAARRGKKQSPGAAC